MRVFTRNGKRRKNWRKLTIIVDIDSQAILSADIGLSNDPKRCLKKIKSFFIP